MYSVLLLKGVRACSRAFATILARAVIGMPNRGISLASFNLTTQTLLRANGRAANEVKAFKRSK